MKRICGFCIVVCMGLGVSAWASEADPSPEAKQMVEQRVASIAPGLSIDSIGFAPIENFYEVTTGTRVVYISVDGKHMFLGELLDANSGENLTEKRRAGLTAGMLTKFDEGQMIVIGPDDPRRYVTVFTDVDCPYCAKFHRDVPALNAAGVQVRYLLFPRTGIGSKSYQRAVGVWCADDRIESIGIAKAGGEVEYRDCENPVKGHYELGQEVGIRGTPAIVLDDGRMVAGYVPPNVLLAELGIVSGTQ
jgi:thiol:disulfide interchange protein DsbC